MTVKLAKTPIISFNNNTPLVRTAPGGIQPRETPSESLKLRIPVKSDHISPKLRDGSRLGIWGIIPSQ